MQAAQAEKTVDMVAVHAFYISLLQSVLGHAVPVPEEVSAVKTSNGSSHVLQRWLGLLDLAITPPMLRDALRDSTTRETAEALLRHFVRKNAHSDVDRDKTDFVITFLYRTIVPSDRHVPQQWSTDHPSEFEEEIYAMLGGEPSLLPEEHRQLVREFPFIREEVEDFRHFDQLMDSGIVQRVREIKQRFGESFYNPRVLAVIAAYNVFFGRRFDELFRDTAQKIKQFASQVQQQGASILSRVDGDVTVKHLTEVREAEIMHTEYGRAQEHFRRISKFKKAVDTRTASQPRANVAPVPPAAPIASPEISRYAQVQEIADSLPSGANPAIELGKIDAIETSIRNFVIAADPKAANVVPLRAGNLSLSSAEVEAFRADYQGEKSFRADYARALRSAVNLQARLIAELQEFRAKQSSAYLWKPHADALTFLMTTSQKLQEQSVAILAVAEQRGLADKSSALNTSLQKLRLQVQLAARAIQENSN